MKNFKGLILGKNGKEYPISEPKKQSGLKKEIIELVLNLAEPDDDCMLSDFIHALQFVLDKHKKQINDSVNKEVLEALKHTLVVLYDCDPPEHLQETYANIFANYNNLVKDCE